MNKRWYRLSRASAFNIFDADAVTIVRLSENEAEQYFKYPDLYAIEPVVVMTQVGYDALINQSDTSAGVFTDEVREAWRIVLAWRAEQEEKNGEKTISE